MQQLTKQQQRFKEVLVLHKEDIEFLKIRRILQNFFKKVYITDNEQIATQYYLKYQPKLIISESKISNFDTINFLKKIRQQDEHISFVFISNDLSHTTLLNVIRLGAIDYLQKPLEVGKLIYAINKFSKKISTKDDGYIYINKSIKYDQINNILYVDDNEKKLTKKEVLFLELLLKNKNRTISTKEIYNHIWADDEVSESAFKSMYNRFTNKLGKDIITNNFGVGYGIFENNKV